jgi:hypothetical protein
LSTSEHTAPNGTAPPVVDALEQYAEGMAHLLAPLSARRAQLEAEVAELVEQEARIKDALSALRGPKRSPRVPPPKDKAKSTNEWRPSQKTLDDVYAALAKADGPLNYSDLAEATGHSRGSVTKAIDILRKEARVRFVGQAGRGQANLYAPMPSG